MASKATCSIDGCERPVVARGYCKRCYYRGRRSGDLAVVSVQLRWPENLLQRMEPQPNGCIYFAGHILSTGYGGLEYPGGTLAHRAAYEHFVGPIPEGHELDHECHNTSGCVELNDACLHRRCVNVDHLAPKPHRDNLLASPNTFAGINAAKTHCKRGHEFTSENTYLNPRGSRVCRTCRAEGKVRARARLRDGY